MYIKSYEQIEIRLAKNKDISLTQRIVQFFFLMCITKIILDRFISIRNQMEKLRSGNIKTEEYNTSAHKLKLSKGTKVDFHIIDYFDVYDCRAFRSAP